MDVKCWPVKKKYGSADTAKEKGKVTMKALLIVNEFLNTIKFSEHAQWLLQAANDQGIEMEVKTNAECLVWLNASGAVNTKLPNQFDFVVFWDKDIRLAAYLEQIGLPVYNSSKAIAVCDDKSMTHLILSKHQIPMPETMFAPMTYPNIGYNNYDFLQQVKDTLGFPMVIKECFGSFGAQVYLVSNEEELYARVKDIKTKPMLFQRFIASSYGRDVRIQVVDGEVVASMYRFSEHGDFRANITNGGSMKRYDPDEAECKLAIECCRHLGLMYAGVDLLFGEHGEPIVCEVNSNAHFKNIYDCTGVNTAQKIMEALRKRRS